MIGMIRKAYHADKSVSLYKVGLATAASLFAMWLLADQLRQIDTAQLGATFQQISLAQWVLALGLTAVSFVSLGQYDVIWHRALLSEIGVAQARRSGMIAIAIGQTLGFCSVTSALARWRALPHLSPKQVAKVSAAVAISFMSIWAVMTLPAFWLMADFTKFTPPAPLLTFALLSVITLCVLRILRQNALQPALIAGLVFWTICDVTAAAGALYVLLPPTTNVGFGIIFASYVLALGSGLFSNAPGGIGVFEMVLLTAMSAFDPTPILAAVLAFRIVYYLIPFVIASVALVMSGDGQDHRRLVPLPPGIQNGFLRHAAHASWGVVRQHGQILRGRNLHFLMLRAPFADISFGDPLRARPDVDGTAQLQRHARENGRCAAIYHASPRMAAVARGQGWATVRIASRAWMNPQIWTVEGAKRQSLRRKLRQAVKAGVSVSRVDPQSCALGMTAIASEWAANHRGQMGFSMGYFCPRYVEQQVVYLIKVNGDPCGFVTFHQGRGSWSLDLIRYRSGLPSGAVQTAIVKAITDAKEDGITEVCLAAAPERTGPIAFICRSRNGLAQFKRGFAPHWQALYLCAPHHLALICVGLGLLWAIQRPLHRVGHLFHQR